MIEKNGCDGCFHNPPCGRETEEDFMKMTETELFEAHCVGCCCGDLFDCNKTTGYGCGNYETEGWLG